MFNITINNKTYEIEENLSIIQACEKAGVKVPRFCYHKDLSVPANCRMCLVEVKGSRKLVPSCYTPIAQDMVINTDTPEVKEVRKGIMEFLLINHPLDCPICDEAGECELQNQAVAYGFNDSNYEFDKRARENKDLGPLVSTYMARCINCTRCIRFLQEVAGTNDLGIVGRGENSDISNYFQTPINSELSGNLVDVCPVGALNNTQYSFRDRPWQLTHTQTIDIMDAMGSSIIVDTEQQEVVRIMPQENPEINGAWISDKARYICDAVDMQRLDTPWIKVKGKLKKATFEEAFEVIKQQLSTINGKQIAALTGNFVDVESMVTLKEFLNKLGSNLIDCRVDNIAFNPKEPQSYLFNSSIQGIDEADCILIVGSNPKIEAPVLNSRILKNYNKNNTKIGVVGEDINLNYPNLHLGNTISVLKELLKSQDSSANSDVKNSEIKNSIVSSQILKTQVNSLSEFSKALQLSKKPMIIVGEGAFINQNTSEVLNLLMQICNKFNVITESWNGYNVISTSIAKIGGLMAEITPQDFNITTQDILSKASSNEVKFMWLLNIDNIDFNTLKNTFLVYQGHHGDKGAEHADVILPGTLWLEKSATYVNMEGRVLQTSVVKKPRALAKEDWKIIKALANYLNIDLPFNTIEDVRVKMQEINPCFKSVNKIYNNTKKYDSILSNLSDKIQVKDLTIKSVINDYYLTDIISKASVTMAKCSQLFNNIK